MPIQEENIVFVESQVMDDVPEGGGAATGRAVDGVLNNVFEDISDLDRAYGRFNLRKLALAVRSLDTSLYGGAKLALTALPRDPAVGYTLFRTADPFDTRAQAADRVQAYLYKGPMWPGVLYDDHIAGMRAIRIIQRVDTTLPPIGKTLVLIHHEGAADAVEQYVRVTDVETVETTLTDANGDYTRWVVTLTLKDALRHDFAGHTPRRDDLYDYDQGARLRDTTVADAARYSGAQPLAEPAQSGDLRVRAASLYSQLVPASQTETPLVNQVMADQLVTEIDAGGGHRVEVSQAPHTRALAVTPENRRLNWVETLSPVPQRGALNIAYMAQGHWYELTDDGTGIIRGSDSTFGSGTIDATTGVSAVTLGALPDAGSQILYTWASPVHYRIRAGATQDTDARGARLDFALEQVPYIPGSLVVTFTRGGSPLTATEDGHGTISGAGVSGVLNLTSGAGSLWFTQLPDRETSIRFDHAYADPDDPEQPAERRVEAALGANYTLDFGGSVAPEGVSIAAYYSYPVSAAVTINDDGEGGLVVATGQAVGDPAEPVTGLPVGTIDYAAGLATLNIPIEVNYQHWAPAVLNPDGSIARAGYWYTWRQSALPSPTNEVLGVAATGAPSSDLVADPIVLDLLDGGLDLDLTHLHTSRIVPGSVRLSLGGMRYEDRGTGVLYDGDGLRLGTLDYDTGIASLTWWSDGANAPPTVTACLTRYGFWVATEASFRTRIAPLKPEALSITVTAEDGARLTASADADGNLVGDAVSGSVNYEFGTAAMAFGAMADDPEHPGSQVWVPRRVDPTTLRYNAVAYSYLPLDADILGIDGTRLPADGRVPIYRPGDLVMILHAAETALSPSAGVATAIGRTRLAWVRVTDATGAVIEGDRYQLDRASGQIMFPDLDGLTLPLTVRHTVGDLRQVTDAQISGWLALSRPLTHDYPAGETIVAGCLIIGDRRARVSATWDQASWSGAWADAPSGSAATATLNLIDHPIQVTNEGCDTDRWVLRCANAASDQWELISENRGLVWQGVYAPGGEDIAPINPRTRIDLGGGAYSTGAPYMTIPAAANGGGWSTGNVVRIDTVGAIAEFWVARSIQQSDEPADPAAADGCEIHALGNIDRP
ncbi:hypothetical protein [Marichromatium gracile]|uniref:Tail protein n=3 Tax=Marichromatium gracile TaxID=1048 RepID=A0A4R4ABC7_MARGR|nr:hypothetical protein [Marichromatium gracile]TCW36283.1 hypothetical protein EDC29_10466 [Marichromatium gracile]